MELHGDTISTLENQNDSLWIVQIVQIVHAVWHIYEYYRTSAPQRSSHEGR